jgi:hypothetical protein
MKSNSSLNFSFPDFPLIDTFGAGELVSPVVRFSVTGLALDPT